MQVSLYICWQGKKRNGLMASVFSVIRRCTHLLRVREKVEKSVVYEKSEGLKLYFGK